MSVDQVGTLVLLALQERGVLLACQDSVDQERMERRAVRGDQASLELLEHLVGNDSYRQVQLHTHLLYINSSITFNFQQV